MDRADKIRWMQDWCDRQGLRLELEGECGFGRECVGVLDGASETYPDYEWDDEDWNRIDPNGDVWRPQDAYHKHPCVAVLGRGVDAEDQLYQWLRWFDDNGFEYNWVPRVVTNTIELMMGRDKHHRMERKP